MWGNKQERHINTSCDRVLKLYCRPRCLHPLVFVVGRRRRRCRRRRRRCRRRRRGPRGCRCRRRLNRHSAPTHTLIHTPLSVFVGGVQNRIHSHSLTLALPRAHSHCLALTRTASHSLTHSLTQCAIPHQSTLVLYGTQFHL